MKINFKDTSDKIQIKSKLKFVKEFLFKPKTTGALAPSSTKLAISMLRHTPIKSAKNIVEIGAGTGVFTKMILKFKDKNAKFFAVELSEMMAKEILAKIKNVDLELGDARNLKEMMKKRDMKQADVIISGIPWTLLKTEEQDKLLRVLCESLSDEGSFATFLYALPTLSVKKFKKKLEQNFKEVKVSKIVWGNVPPAVVYCCKK